MNNIFKNWFSGFLRGRRATLLFGRHVLLETVGERVWLVRRGIAHTNIDCAYDPHAKAAIHREQSRYTADHHDALDHGGWYLPAHGSSG